MASDPALLTLLVGLGLTEFSMTPGAIGVAKKVLSEVRSDDLRRWRDGCGACRRSTKLSAS